MGSPSTNGSRRSRAQRVAPCLEREPLDNTTARTAPLAMSCRRRWSRPARDSHGTSDRLRPWPAPSAASRLQPTVVAPRSGSVRAAGFVLCKPWHVVISFQTCWQSSRGGTDSHSHLTRSRWLSFAHLVLEIRRIQRRYSVSSGSNGSRLSCLMASPSTFRPQVRAAADATPARIRNPADHHLDDAAPQRPACEAVTAEPRPLSQLRSNRPYAAGTGCRG
jgi:hypothetical protein